MFIKTLPSKIIRTLQNEGFRALVYKSFQKIRNIGGRDYKAWIEKYESYDPDQVKIEIEALKKKPSFSVVTPVFNPKIDDLKAAIESVESQLYQNWELWLADASTNQAVKDFLKQKSHENKKIKVKFLQENISIAANTNQALKLASAEFIVFLDHDDLLAPFALFEVAKEINKNPEVELIYSDEDKINSRGRFQPHFKPDWSPELLTSFNYITHIVVVSSKLLKQIGGLREGYNGAQDYELLLRLTEQTDKIAHISKILYHWRVGRFSTASDISAKSYAQAAGQRALEDKFKRLNIPVQIEETKYPCLYRVRYRLKEQAKISIIIPTKDKVETLKKCVDSIKEKSTYKNYEILIIDNNSIEDETKLYLKTIEKERTKVLQYNKEFNFSAINNFASKSATGKYLVFLNNDTEIITPDWLESLLEQAQRDEVGAVGAKLYYPNKTIQHAGVVLGLGQGFAGHVSVGLPKEATGYYARLVAIQNYLAVTAACLMIRKEVFAEVGGFDENLKLAFNDVDLCLKIFQKGYRIVWIPYAELYHYESATRGYDKTDEQKLKFQQETTYCLRKWSKVFSEGDPYFNPNLSLTETNFKLKK